VKWTKDQGLKPLTELSYSILRSEGVRSVFGIPIEIHNHWPFVEDSNGDKIVSQISQQLRWPGEGHPVITREHFANLQRAALRGAEALATVIDFDETKDDADLDILITRCYTWGAALKSVHTTVRGGADREVVRELPEATVLRPAELVRR
jgi:hypothetical protein